MEGKGVETSEGHLVWGKAQKVETTVGSIIKRIRAMNWLKCAFIGIHKTLIWYFASVWILSNPVQGVSLHPSVYECPETLQTSVRYTWIPCRLRVLFPLKQPCMAFTCPPHLHSDYLRICFPPRSQGLLYNKWYIVFQLKILQWIPTVPFALTIYDLGTSVFPFLKWEWYWVDTW